MNGKYKFITAISVILALMAVLGYALPQDHPKIPVRIHMENGGGPVLFDHRAHERYDVHCEACHHAGKTEATEVPCTACHPAQFDDEFRTTHIARFKGKAACSACHHLEWDRPIFDHPMHEDIADCSDCHHGENIESQPQRCINCHAEVGLDQTGTKGKHNLRQAVHTRCSQCHEDLYDQGLAGCASCHSKKDVAHFNMSAPASCRECHDKPHADLVPTRRQAFHGQCMGCHEKRKKGPYRDTKEVKDCGRCHLAP